MCQAQLNHSPSLKYLMLPAALQPQTPHPMVQMETPRPTGMNYWPTIIQLAELGSNRSCVSQPLAKGVSKSDRVTDEPHVLEARSVSSLGKNSLRGAGTLSGSQILHPPWGNETQRFPWLFPHQKMEQALPMAPHWRMDSGVSLTLLSLSPS